jgi:hypothetical protein
MSNAHETQIRPFKACGFLLVKKWINKEEAEEREEGKKRRERE